MAPDPRTVQAGRVRMYSLDDDLGFTWWRITAGLYHDHARSSMADLKLIATIIESGHAITDLMCTSSSWVPPLHALQVAPSRVPWLAAEFLRSNESDFITKRSPHRRGFSGCTT
jgi:hypothetical protein